MEIVCVSLGLCTCVLKEVLLVVNYWGFNLFFVVRNKKGNGKEWVKG